MVPEYYATTEKCFASHLQLVYLLLKRLGEHLLEC